jgi:NitT/TauT family transport system substrate-binding protein
VPAQGIHRTHRAALFAALALSCSLSGCGLLAGEEEPAGAGGPGGLEKPVITVSVMTTIDMAPFHLAVRNGYFRDLGLEVRTVTAASGQASVAKLIGGDVDIAYGSYPPFFIARSRGVADIKLVADASSASPGSTMVVSVPGSTVRGLQDMAGKRIAITSEHTTSDTMIKSAMRTHGVDFGQVSWISMAFPDMPAALRRGDVDAAFMTEPFLTQSARTTGTVGVFDLATGPTEDFPTAGYAALGTFTRDNPKTVAAFQAAMRRATEEAANRAVIEPLLVDFAKVDKEIAAATTLLDLHSTLDPARLQRVPDLLLEFSSISTPVDVRTMIAP